MAAFAKVVVANRGAVAARVLRALNALGVRSVAVYSDADRDAPWLEMVERDRAHRRLAAARESYLNQDALLDVCPPHPAPTRCIRATASSSENAGFARRVEDAGMRFIGPSPRWIDAMGHKTRARELAGEHGLPVGRGSGVLSGGADEILRAAEEIGYPVLVKPAAGGGGIGMLPARNPERARSPPSSARPRWRSAASPAARSISSAWSTSRATSRSSSWATAMAACVHLFERDCSVQRRHQKIIEEATAPGIAARVMQPLLDRIAETFARLGYDNLGTVEMLLAPDGEFRFLEMNTRLQVEHGVTEEVTGIDLVTAQVRSAAGRAARRPSCRRRRAATVTRSRRASMPRTRSASSPPPARCASSRRRSRPRSASRPATRRARGHAALRPAARQGDRAWRDRAEAIDRLVAALAEFRIEGVKHNIPALVAILESEEFRAGQVHTGLAAEVVGRASLQPVT